MKHASAEPGTCNAKSADMLHRGWGTLATPNDKGRYHLYIDRGYAQDHHAFYAQWDGDDAPVVIDHTIKQFGGDAMVFIGSKEEWIEEVRRLTSAKSIKEDDRDGTLYNAAFEAELEAEMARPTAHAQEQQRNALRASRDVHENKCLQKCVIQ